MSADTVWAFQLMYAVANARIACVAVGAARAAFSGGGGGEGYSWTAWARASADEARRAGEPPPLPPPPPPPVERAGRADCPHPAHASAQRSATLARCALIAPPGGAPRTR